MARWRALSSGSGTVDDMGLLGRAPETVPSKQRSARGLLLHPPQDGARVGEYRPVRQLERRQVLRAGRPAQLLPRALAPEPDRAAVRRDDLLVRDPLGAHRL